MASKKISYRFLIKPLIPLLFALLNYNLKAQQAEDEINISLDDSLKMEFVWIEGLDIWVGKFEVTNEQYEKFMRFRDGSKVAGLNLGGRQQPAVFVSYCDTEGFMYWLNTNVEMPDGFSARLPSKNEWDFFLRSYKNQKYPWGNDWPPESGNYLDQTGYDSLKWEWCIDSYRDNFAVSAPVELSVKNNLGIHGLLDNVREWTSEKSQKEGWFYIRGGSWRDSKKEHLETHYKVAGAKWGKDNHIGFRVVLAVSK